MSKEANSQVQIAATKEQAALIDEIKEHHAGFNKSFEHQAQYAFLMGMRLNDLKESCKHGEFLPLREVHLPEISERTGDCYMGWFRLVKGKSALCADFCPAAFQLSNGDLPVKQKTLLLQAVNEVCDGKSWTALYRGTGKMRDPKPAGGFRPDNKAVQEWLKKHHPDLAGTKFDNLPAKLQKAFKKQYRPKALPPEMIAEARRAEGSAAFDLLATQMHEKTCMHWEEAFKVNFRKLLKDYVALLDKHINKKGEEK